MGLAAAATAGLGVLTLAVQTAGVPEASTAAATADTMAARIHANAEHPALAQWRHAHARPVVALDPNRFVVQPPASTTQRIEAAPPIPQAVVAVRP